MLDLARSLDPTRPGQKALQDKELGAYLKGLETEPHGQLRNFMLFDLDRFKGALPAAVRPTDARGRSARAPVRGLVQERQHRLQACVLRGRRFNGLPSGITHHDAMEANHLDEDLSAGGTRPLGVFKETLKAKGIAL